MSQKTEYWIKLNILMSQINGFYNVTKNEFFIPKTSNLLCGKTWILSKLSNLFHSINLIKLIWPCKTTYEWHTNNDINVHLSNIRITHEYIQVTYEWHTSTYEWDTDDVRVHTRDIRMTYEWHTNGIRVHKST